MEIENSVAIITGGASGLGEATVRSLHSKKCKVCIFDNNIEKGVAIAEELGTNVAFFKVDVWNTIEFKGSIEICLNSSKILFFISLAELFVKVSASIFL